MPEVTIVQLTAPALTALAEGDLATASELSGLPLPHVLISEEWIGTFRRRDAQVRADAAHAAWVTGIVCDGSTGEVVGKAGFHEPPDADGMVEVGYQIIPEKQRQGYGSAALRFLIARAKSEPMVQVVRACIRPDNVPSLAMVQHAGFEQVGQEWDEDDQQWELDFRYRLRATS